MIGRTVNGNFAIGHLSIRRRRRRPTNYVAAVASVIFPKAGREAVALER